MLQNFLKDMSKRIINLFAIANITSLLIGCSAQTVLLHGNRDNDKMNGCASAHQNKVKSDLASLYGVYRYNSFKDNFDLDVDNEGLLLILPLHHRQSQYKGRIVLVQTCLWSHQKNKVVIYDDIEYRGNFLVQNEKVLFTVEYDNEGNAITIKGKSPYLQNSSDVRLSNEYVRICELP